ncbi:MAG: hypothetical protein ACFCU1_08720 [Sumerlaeia bacterium]
MANLDEMIALLKANESAKALRAAREYYNQDTSSDKDKAVAIARAAALLYRDFLTDPILEFAAHTSEVIPEPAGSIIRKGLERLTAQAADWAVRLENVRNERLARDLREFIRQGKQKEAFEHVDQLFEIAKEKKQSLRKRAAFIGSVVGSVLSREAEGKKLAGTIISRHEKLGITPEDAQELETARLRQRDELMAANLDNLENQWKKELKEAQVEIINAMPSKNKMGDPDDDDLRTVTDLFRCILRVPLHLKKLDYFVDATLILVDFCPRETAAIAKQSGVEGRSYDELGFRAKKAVGLAFLELGERQAMTAAYLKWVDASKDSPHLSYMIELMGAFRNNIFAAPLLEFYRDRTYKNLHNDALMALSNLTTRSVAELFLTELDKLLRSAKTLDPSIIRNALVFIDALGRMVRSPRSEVETQKFILHGITVVIPQNENRLALPAVRNVLIPKSAMLTETDRDWVVLTLVEALFIPQQRTSFEKSPEKKSDILGNRSGIVKLLERLSESAEDSICRIMEPKARRYSAAFLAAAEVLQKVKCRESLEILELMSETMIEVDEDRLQEHQREEYFDSTTETYKPITKDMIMAVIVYAVAELGGPHAKPILKKILSAYRKKELILNGGETLEQLSRYLGTEFSYDAKDESVDEESSSSQENILSSPLAAQPVRAERKTSRLSNDEIAAHIKTLGGLYFFSKSKKIADKVQALAVLAQHTPQDALDAVFSQLYEKEPMIHSAAISTVAAYANAHRGEFTGKETLMRCLDGLESNKERFREGCRMALKNMTGKAVREEIHKFGQLTDNGSVRIQVQEILGTFLDSAPAAEYVEEEPNDTESQSAGTADRGSASSSKIGVAQTRSSKSAFELKREYFAARQAWLAGGKKGPEPKAPPGYGKG